jgi:hypothetical protein
MDGTPSIGHVACNKADCPICSKTYHVQSAHKVVTKIKAAQLINPKLRVYAGYSAMRDECKGSVTLQDIDDFRLATNSILRSAGVTDAIKVFHPFKVKKESRAIIENNFYKEKGLYPSGSEVYKLATSNGYWESMGYRPNYRDHVELHPHEHILMLCESDPAIRIRKGMKNKYADTVRFNMYSPASKSMDLEYSDNISSIAASRSASIDTDADLIKHLLYLFNHTATLTNAPGRNILSHVNYGDLRQNFKNVNGENIYRTAAVDAFRAMATLGMKIKLIVPYSDDGDFKVFPSSVAPSFNEDVTASAPHVENPDFIKWQDFIYPSARIDSFVNSLPPLNQSFWLDFISILDEKHWNASVPFSLKGVFWDEIPGIDTYLANGVTPINQGLVKKVEFLGVGFTRTYHAPEEISYHVPGAW